MITRFTIALLFCLSIFAGGSTANAMDKMAVTKLDDLMIVDPTIRPTPPGAPVSGGYVTIKNTGTQADRLVAVKTAFAGKNEIHEMKMDGGIMKMRPLKAGIELPAGGEVKLMPGGLHLMFMKLTEQMKEGTGQKVTLVFERAGQIEIDFEVKMPSASGDHNG